MLLSGSVGCGNPGDAVQRIPGTEFAATKDKSITISPDEKWLLLWEWVITPGGASGDVKPPLFKYHLVSIDLRSNTRTPHRLDSIPPGAIPTMQSNAEWSVLAWLAIHTAYDQAGWDDCGFHIDISRSNNDVLIVPGEPYVQLAPIGTTQKTCVDCPPPFLLKSRLGAVDRTPGRASVSWSNGEAGTNVYLGVRDGDSVALMVRQQDGAEQSLLRKSSKAYSLAIATVRVSPDERYVAYEFYSRFRSPIPVPGRRQVFILDLATLQEKRVAKPRFVGNLMWSADSNRLYFTASEYGTKDAGVYVVDVQTLFD